MKRAVLLLTLAVAEAGAATFSVGRPAADCPSPRYGEIEAALSGVRPWDEIRICSGTYRAPAGGFVIAKEGLRLVAKGAVRIVPGAGRGPAVVVAAEHVRVEGLEIGGFDGAAIQVGGAFAEVEHNYLHENGAGIAVRGTGHAIRHNVVRHSRGAAIVVGGPSKGTVIFHNLLHHNREGIQAQGMSAKVVGNILRDNGLGAGDPSHLTSSRTRPTGLE